jgi:hypothetical protein
MFCGSRVVRTSLMGHCAAAFNPKAIKQTKIAFFINLAFKLIGYLKI